MHIYILSLQNDSECKGFNIYGSGHEGVAVLLPGDRFTIEKVSSLLAI